MKSLQGVLSSIPGDKSITHRAIIMASLAEGESEIVGSLSSEDCKRTLLAFQQMGVSIDKDKDSDSLYVQGQGFSSLVEPSDVIDCGNSGTTLRLLTGILAGQFRAGHVFHTVLTGDASLKLRPMRRVVDPLRQMGAEIDGRSDANLAPLSIRGRKLTAIQYTLPVASAQVKSALLLAGLTASGTTSIIDPYGTRDHTERMFQHFGVAFKLEGNGCSTLVGGNPFRGKTVHVPGDFSSAAFFIVAALILPDSHLLIKNVGVNPTRTGLLAILNQMGANITVEPVTNADPSYGYEPIANIRVATSLLKGCVVDEDLIPQMIDEFPALCVAAAAAEGETIIRGAKELRVKESDRILTMANALRCIPGVSVEELPDGIKIKGTEKWRRFGAGLCITKSDHRVAMAMKIASLRTEGETIRLDDEVCINTSFPEFNNILEKICH